MSTKQSLKAIQVQLKNEDYEAALHNATTLLKSLKKDDPEAASVLCYRGLALSYLQRTEECEKCYIGAYKLKPDHPLASKAIKQLYIKSESWDKLGLFLERLVQDAYEANDAEVCSSTLAELLELREAHGPPERLYITLSLLLPSSPLLPLLQPLTPPSNTYTPFPQPIYPPASLSIAPPLPKPLPHPLHLQGSLALLLNLLIWQQSIIHHRIDKDVKDARMKIGAKSEKETRRAVEGQVLGGEEGGRLVELLREVAGHPSVEEGVRRRVEIDEFEYWKKLVGVLSDESKPAKKPKSSPTPADDTLIPPAALFTPSPYTPPTKSQALSRVDSLANGFILLQLAEPAEGAYEWVLEGTDSKDIYYPLDLLHQYAVKFPESPMGELIDDYCRWFKLAPPPAEDQGGVNGTEGKESIEDETGGKKEKPRTKSNRWKKGKKGMNARERRKARRVAGQEGTLSEDVEAEERDELVADMTKMLDKLPRSIFAHRVLAKISLQEDDLANAVAYAEKGRLLLKELQNERGITLPGTAASLDTALGIALVPYYAPKHHARATRLLNSAIAFDANNNEARFARAQIYQHAADWSAARETFQQVLDLSPGERLELSTTEEIGWCLVNEGKLDEGRDVLEDTAMRKLAKWEERGSKEGDDAFGRARGWYRLGQTEWMINTAESKSQAEEWFTTSLRALPTFAPSYTALGLVFADAGDAERAQKCFQKAFELDATEADAAERLARGYANDDEWALVRAIATRVMEGEGGVEGVAGGDVLAAKGRFAPKNGWAWKALGSTEMYYRNYVKASQSFQIALRALPEDIPTHVLLAEAYIKSGKHIAALKTLDKVLELDPNHWIAKYDIALIHVELGHFGDAITIYEQLNTQKPGQVGILAALAGAWLSQGREMLNGGFRQRANRAFVQAMQRAQEVIGLERQYRTWGWKVVADAAFEMSGLGVEEEDVQVLKEAADLLASQDEDKRATISGVRTFGQVHGDQEQMTTVSLRVAITAFTWRAYLLRDDRAPVVMSALYDQAAALHTLVRASSDEAEKMAASKAAITALRRALEKDSSDERLWNALGVLCAEGGKAVAQHAFVVSLDLYTKDPITWTNLGYLYLQLDERDLANQCFLKSQTLDPDYARAWLGQGFLAQRDGQMDGARGIFAHAVTLAAGSLIEADLAAAATIYERYMIPGWYDVGELHQPAFALKRYIHRKPQDSVAVHLYGLISEKLGMVDEAEAAFETSVALLEDEFEKTESESVEQRYAIALANLGRVRMANGAYDMALEAFSSCWDLIQDTPAVDSPNGQDQGKGALAAGLKTQVKLSIAISKNWTGDVEGCLEEFENALTEAEASGVEGLKDGVVVLLARTLWALGEEGRDVAKGHLMECLSSESPDLNVISALGAIALSTSDSDLLEAVSSELSSLPAHARSSDRADLAGLVLSTSHMISGDTETATSDLAAALQADPWNTTIRARLASLYLAQGQAGEARDLLYMDMRDTEAELVQLRGIARVQCGEKDGMGEVQRGVRAKPWENGMWKGLEWGVMASEGLEEEVFEPDAEEEGQVGTEGAAEPRS